MTSPINFDNVTSQELKKFIFYFNNESSLYTSKELARADSSIITALALLKPKYTFMFMQCIDSFYPGLSVHFLMQAQHTMSREHALFLFRISYHIYIHPEKQLLHPMRTRLVKGLLFDVKEKDIFLKSLLLQLKTAISAIHALSLLTRKEKLKIANHIFNQSFEQYFQSSHYNLQTLLNQQH